MEKIIHIKQDLIKALCFHDEPLKKMEINIDEKIVKFSGQFREKDLIVEFL